MTELSTILTVEDNPNIRKMIAYNLRRAGFKTIEACDGKEAVRVLQKVVPDLMILDVRMPEMNGFQLLELMRKYPRAAAIPVVMLSALSQPENIDRALKLGVVDYIVKPLDPAVLITKVKSALEGAKAGGLEPPQQWQGAERRATIRIAPSDIELEPSPGGRLLDISEGGMSWRCKVPPAEGDIMEVNSALLRSRLQIGDDAVIRLRVVNVKSVGLGYSRVGACFIGLSTGLKQSIRNLIDTERKQAEASESRSAPSDSI
jgi:CheY-like chemotaxis protein